jgi:hypothetical protein
MGMGSRATRDAACGSRALGPAGVARRAPAANAASSVRGHGDIPGCSRRAFASRSSRRLIRWRIPRGWGRTCSEFYAATCVWLGSTGGGWWTPNRTPRWRMRLNSTKREQSMTGPRPNRLGVLVANAFRYVEVGPEQGARSARCACVMRSARERAASQRARTHRQSEPRGTFTVCPKHCLTASGSSAGYFVSTFRFRLARSG